MASWYTVPAFEPIKYIPASQKDDIRAQEVSSIHAVAHAQENGPYHAGFTNHWCLYLQTGIGRSVCVNMQPNPQQSGTVISGGSKGDLLISLMSHLIPSDATHSRGLAPKTTTLVRNLLDLLAEQGRHRYEFTPQGVGCRRWVRDTLTLLADRGLLDEQEVKSTLLDIGKLWPQGSPLELDSGMYYEH